MADRPRWTVVSGLGLGVVAVSAAAILIRVALEDADPLAIAFWRSFGGAVALAPFAVRHARRDGPVSSTRRRQLAWSGVFLGLHFGLWLWSLELTTVASSVTLVTMSPIFVALGAARFLGEPTARRTWVGMGITIAGALAVGLADGVAVDLGPTALAGDALAFGGALAVTGYLLLGRVARRDVPATRYSSSVFAVAAAVLLGACLATGTPLWGYSGTTWLALAGLVVGPQLLGHSIFNALLSRVQPTVVSIVVLGEPVGATLLAWLFLDELPAPLFWVGAPLVLAGVFVATRRRATLSGVADEIATPQRSAQPYRS